MQHCYIHTLDVDELDVSEVMVVQQVVAVRELERLVSRVVLASAMVVSSVASAMVVVASAMVVVASAMVVSSGGVVVVGLQVVVVLQPWLA